ncbi:MAG: ATP-grasp domain-containing protein [Halobacteriota archaeon]|jgi:carbamoyl-phosphate synthase large subunit
MNVAVTAVGGVVGQGIIKSLQNTEYDVVAIDPEELATGLYAARKSCLGLYAKDKEFINRIVEICKTENCKIIFPGMDVELIPLSNQASLLKANGIYPVVSRPEVVKICDNKMLTLSFLKRHNFPYPKSFDLREYAFELDFPVIFKPKKGEGSAGVFLVDDKEQFDAISKSLDASSYIVQEYIDGEEYTCGTVTLQNKCIGVILMKRQLRAGATYKAFVVKNDALEKFIKNVITTLKPFGACNIQLRMIDNVPFIFDINARCSGATPARTLAGFNEPKIICDFVSKGVNDPKFSIREVAILRYWSELAVSYNSIKEMRNNGCVNGSGARLWGY